MRDTTRMNKPIIITGTILGAVLIVLIILFVQQQSSSVSPAQTSMPMTPPLPNNIVQYQSEEYGISFVYPNTYYLMEKETGSPERPQHTIVLVEDTQENRDVIKGTSTEPREEPTTITIDIHQNLMQYNPQLWIQNDTNWTLGNQQITESTIATKPAFSFTWSGLYEGQSTVISNAPYMYVFSVTSLTPDDQIIKDYNELLRSTEFPN